MNTNQKGVIAEQKVILKAAELGLVVSKPVFPESRYDLVIEKDGKLHKVQVKYCGSKIRGSYRIGLTKHTGGYNRKLYTYSEEEIDCVIAYLPDEDVLVWLPQSLCVNRGAVALRSEAAKNGQSKGINLVQDYIWSS